MSSKLSPKEALAMYYLLFTQEKPFQSEMQPELAPKERQNLIANELITLVKSGRGRRVELTDAAWDWAEENLGCPLSQSKVASKALQALLGSLRSYREKEGMRLSELVSAKASSSASGNPIHDAYLALARGQPNRPIKIADLSDALPSMESGRLLRDLQKLQEEGRVFFSRGDDPQNVSERDRRVSVRVGGEEMYLVAFIG